MNTTFMILLIILSVAVEFFVISIIYPFATYGQVTKDKENFTWNCDPEYVEIYNITGMCGSEDTGQFYCHDHFGNGETVCHNMNMTIDMEKH